MNSRVNIFLVISVIALKLIGQPAEKSYEQIAIDFFNEMLTINKLDYYDNVKYFIFNGNIEEEESICCSFCILIPYDSARIETNDKSVSIPRNKRIVPRLNFLKRLFINKKRVGHIFLYKAYPYRGNVVVVIQSDGKLFSDFFTIVIDYESKSVIDYCLKKYDVSPLKKNFLI